MPKIRYFREDAGIAQQRLNTGPFQWFNLNVAYKNGPTLAANKNTF